MPSNNNILGIGRLTGRLLAAFALGTILGFAVFYWFAQYAAELGLLIADFLTVILVFFVLVVGVFVFYFLQVNRPQMSNVFCWLFSVGWLLAIVLGVVFYPGYDRYITPPKIVQQQAQVLEQQLAEYPILWEVGMDNPRKEVRFELKPKTKGIGYMPHSLLPWIMEWHVYYKDGSDVSAVFYLNGVEPARLYSASFYYSKGNFWWQMPTMGISDPKYLDYKSILSLPWTWGLSDPSQQPSTVELSTKESGDTEVMAAYSEGAELSWTRRYGLYKSVNDEFIFSLPKIKSPCREGWARINICLPLKSTQAIPPGLVLFQN